MQRQGLLKAALVVVTSACATSSLAACEMDPSPNPISSYSSSSLPSDFRFSCPSSSSLVESVSGVEITIESVSAHGMRFLLDNTTDLQFGYGEDYALCVFRKGTWEIVMPITEQWIVPSVGHALEPHSKTEAIAIDWSELFGELPHGQYEIQKNLWHERSPTAADEYVLGQVFELP